MFDERATLSTDAGKVDTDSRAIGVLTGFFRTFDARDSFEAWFATACCLSALRPGPSRLDPHRSILETHWKEGRRNSAVLYRELQALGFEGGYDIVRRWAARRRQEMRGRPPAARTPSTRQVTRWLTRDPAALSGCDRGFVEALRTSARALAAAAEHVRTFHKILKSGEPVDLKPWLEVVITGNLCGFAAGLEQDDKAVCAAIAEPWSNGPVEGQINRLKLIKRSMHGRAEFDLLRQRVLHGKTACP